MTTTRDPVHPSGLRLFAAALLACALTVATLPFVHVTRAAAFQSSNDLAGWWSFDEGHGTTSADLSGNGNPATVGSGDTWTTSTPPLDAPNPYALASTTSPNSVTTAPGNAVDGLSAFTIAVWVRLDPIPAGTTESADLFEIAGKTGFHYQQDSRAVLNFDVTGSVEVGEPLPFAQGTWHHLAITFATPDQLGNHPIAVYVDGQAVESISTLIPASAGTGVVFGNFAGALDDARIYDRALSPLEVDQLAHSGCTHVTGIPVSECQALQSLYENTNGLSWTNQSGWLVNDTPCSWYGVLCDNGHVAALDLRGNGIAGTFPGGLGGLPDLIVLDLAGNQLSGPIPIDLGNLTNLQTLDLSGNQLSGTIPVTLGNDTAIHLLNLSDDALSGDIPTQFANLTGVSSLDLAYNGLSASDPSVISYLNVHEPDWAATQTVTPAGVHAVTVSPTSISVGWTPIAYTADGGFYDVLVSPGGSGVFQSAAHTVDKTAAGFVVTGLAAGQSYQVSVRTTTPAHSGQTNSMTSVGSPPITPDPTPSAYTSYYAPNEAPNLYRDAVFFHHNDLASTQHDATMFVAFLGALVRNQHTTPPDLGYAPGNGPIAVTTSYAPADISTLQQAATTFSTDVSTMQHAGIDLVAYLLALSGP